MNSEESESTERITAPHSMVPAVFFEADNMADVAEKLNEMVGNVYTDAIGNAFKLTGFYHFQAVRVDEWHSAEAGSTQSMKRNTVYEIVALPIYEHVEWLSKPKSFVEVVKESVVGVEPASAD